MEDNEQQEENESYSSKYKDEAMGAYKQFDNALTIKSSDNFLIKIAKVLARILGIGFIILISPFVMVGLFLALVAAG